MILTKGKLGGSFRRGFSLAVNRAQQKQKKVSNNNIVLKIKVQIYMFYSY